MIPLMILNALERRPLPVTDGARTCATGCSSTTMSRRCSAWVEKGRVGETYNIGGVNEQRNIDVVHMICDLVDEMRPDGGGDPATSTRYLCRGSPRP